MRDFPRSGLGWAGVRGLGHESVGELIAGQNDDLEGGSGARSGFARRCYSNHPATLPWRTKPR